MAALSRRLLSLSAPTHSRRIPWQTSSSVRYPHSRRFNVTVVVARSFCRRRDAASSGTTRDRRHRRRRWGRRRRLFARHRRPRCAVDSPPLTAVESVDCLHRATISPPGIIVLGLAIGEVTSCSPHRDPEIPRDRTRCPTSLHRKLPPPPLERKPPQPQTTPPTADGVESTMPCSPETLTTCQSRSKTINYICNSNI
jgi:hypothetical protein